MQTYHNIESGLNDLSLFPQEPKRQDSFCRSFSGLLSSSSTMIGDYIGMESCVDVHSDGDQSELLDCSRTTATSTVKRGRHRRSSSAAAANYRREFPPPIPSLAQTENLHSRMPWVLRRHYTGDGRLILTEEKVRHHEYFRAHRCNGRLTLHLVPLDGAVLPLPLANQDDKEIIERESKDENADDRDQDYQDQEEGGTGGGDDDCGEMDSGDEDDEEEEECGDDDKNGNEKQGIGGGTGGNMCYNYSGGRCTLGVPMPAVRPVHS